MTRKIIAPQSVKQPKNTFPVKSMRRVEEFVEYTGYIRDEDYEHLPDITGINRDNLGDDYYGI